jgi:gluconolactonase
LQIHHFLFCIALFSQCNVTNKVTDLTTENSFTENCEGPSVDKSGRLYVVNYQKDGTVGVFHPSKGFAGIFVTLPEGSTANATRFDSKGDMVLADFSGHNILKINMLNNEVSTLCHDARFNQPNDLCITRDDVIYASDPKWSDGTGQLWKIANGKATLLEANMGTTNGIELSPDEQTLYVNESIQRKVWAYTITSAGVSNKRLFAQFEDFGLDGMKCDKKGNLYVTRWGKGTVAVFSPAGKLLREVAVRGKKVSNLTFGGKDGKTVFVTVQDRKCVEMFRNGVAGKGF